MGKNYYEAICKICGHMIACYGQDFLSQRIYDHMKRVHPEQPIKFTSDNFAYGHYYPDKKGFWNDENWIITRKTKEWFDQIHKLREQFGWKWRQTEKQVIAQAYKKREEIRAILNQ